MNNPITITQLIDMDADRVDGVGSPANGISFLLAKSESEYQDLVKAKYNADQLKELKSKGQTYPGTTSYPIADTEDLKNAIHAVGRGKVASHNALRAYIMRRAKALGESKMIPDNWQSDGSLAKAANDIVPNCATCNGTGKVDFEVIGIGVCPDCGGTGLSSDQGGGDGSVISGESIQSVSGQGTVAKSEPPTDKVVDKLIEQLVVVVQKLVEAQKADVIAASKIYKDSSNDDTANSNRDVADSSGNSVMKTNAALLNTIEALQGLVKDEEPSSIEKETEIDMTPEELSKAIADAIVQAEAAREEIKKAKKAEKKAKNAKVVESDADDSDDDSDDDDMSKSAEGSTELLKGVDELLSNAIKPLIERIETIEKSESDNRIFVNAAGLSAVARGVTPESVDMIKSLEDKYNAATDPFEKAKLGNELTVARFRNSF